MRSGRKSPLKSEVTAYSKPQCGDFQRPAVEAEAERRVERDEDPEAREGRRAVVRDERLERALRVVAAGTVGALRDRVDQLQPCAAAPTRLRAALRLEAQLVEELRLARAREDL